MSNNSDSGQATYYPPTSYGNVTTIVGPGIGTKTPGVYGFDTTAGQAYVVLPDGTPFYPGAATLAISNATVALLASRSQSDGPQLADGNRWLWTNTAPPNTDGGKYVASNTGGYWYRETGGRVASRAWYPKPNPQDDTSALIGALAVRQTGEVLEIPPGITYLKNGTLDLTPFKGGLAGADSSSVIQCSGLPDYAAYIKTQSMPFRKNATIRNLRIEGPGGMSDGNPGTNKSVGIQMFDSDKFEDVYVTGFLFGYDSHNPYGHLTWINCTTIGNYYGVHNTIDGYDNLMVGGLIHGNHYANLSCNWDSTISGYMERVHLGGAPVTFYQFAAPNGTPTGPGVTGLFMTDLVLRTSRFEGCGRAIAYSENPYAHSHDLDWDDVGYALTSEASALAVAFGRDTGVPLQLGYLTGDNRINMRGFPIAQAAGARVGGIRGAMSIEALYGPLTVTFSANTSLDKQQIRIAGGVADLLQVEGHLLNNTYGKLQVNAGGTNETISTGLYVPADCAYVTLMPQQSLTNLRWEPANDGDGQLLIIVQHDAAPAFSIVRWKVN